ncbi:MAG: LemA family protein [Alphaproteobacteria bacterium]
MTELTILLALAGLLLVWGIAIFNRLVRQKNLVKEGWSGIDVQLKRRANLIPNLIETVKGYIGHERTLLEEVTALRSRSMAAASPGERGPLEGALTGLLGRLFAVAEAYPELKADRTFLELQSEIAETEDQVQLARRYYNGATRDFNITIESFPSNVVAGLFHFTQAEYFEIGEAADRAVPKVGFGQPSAAEGG